METLESTLEKGEVPASLSGLRVASLLLNNSNVVFGDRQGNPQNFIIALGITSAKMGLGLDVGPTMATHCKAAIHGLVTWMRATGADFKNGVMNASTTLYSEIGELLDQDMLDRAERGREFSPESHAVLLANEEMLKRNAHTEPRVLTGANVVDWSALLMPGGLRPFVISVISALYHEGNKTGVDRLLQCMFGSFYKSDVDSVETTPGAKGVYFGAFVQFQVKDGRPHRC